MAINSSAALASFTTSADWDPANCTFLSHCITDELSDSSITCSFVWDVALSRRLYAPYVAAIEAVFFLISFVWNIFIAVSFIKEIKLLTNPACIYLLNMAVIDILASIFIIFQCLMVESVQHFVLGSTDIVRCGTCEFLGFVMMFLIMNMLHTLVVLSLDRFFFLVKPLTYSKSYSWKMALLIVLAVWVLSFFLALPPLFGLGSYSFNTVISNCHPQWSGMSKAGLRNIYYIIFIALEVVVPIGVLILSNIWIVRIILTSISNRYQRRRESCVGVNEEQVEMERRRESEEQRQVLKVFGVFFIAHCCCWAPVLTFVVIASLVGPSSIREEGFIVSWIFFLSNPVVHPIIETYFIKDLRTAIRNKVKVLLSNGDDHARHIK